MTLNTISSGTLTNNTRKQRLLIAPLQPHRLQQACEMFSLTRPNSSHTPMTQCVRYVLWNILLGPTSRWTKETPQLWTCLRKTQTLFSSSSARVSESAHRTSDRCALRFHARFPTIASVPPPPDWAVDALRRRWGQHSRVGTRGLPTVCGLQSNSCTYFTPSNREEKNLEFI